MQITVLEEGKPTAIALEGRLDTNTAPELEEFAGGPYAKSVAYLVVLLQPVALAALLLGTLPGALTGLFAGAVLFAHAALMPLHIEPLLPYTHAATVPSRVFFVGLHVLRLFWAGRNLPPVRIIQ